MRVTMTKGPERAGLPPVGGVSTRAVGWGLLAAATLMAFYAATLVLASGLGHLGTQLALDWPWIIAITAGFGVQVALLVILRERQRARAELAAAGTGAGASVLGMVACCAHHLADIAPLVGVNLAATFLATYRIPFMAIGITVNAIAIAVTARRLHNTPALPQEH